MSPSSPEERPDGPTMSPEERPDDPTMSSEAVAASERTEETASRPLKVHHLRPAPGARTKPMRVGRGEGSKGKTAGRGTKGTRARGGVPARFEGGQMPLHMRIPKLKGFTNPFRTEYQVVNTGRLAELFPDGGQVGPEELVAKGAVRADCPVKVLGTGEIGVSLQVRAHKFSGSARDKITSAGGSATTI